MLKEQSSLAGTLSPQGQPLSAQSFKKQDSLPDQANFTENQCSAKIIQDPNQENVGKQLHMSASGLFHNLNSSIEDLLSKISRVTSEHEEITSTPRSAKEIKAEERPADRLKFFKKKHKVNQKQPKEAQLHQSRRLQQNVSKINKLSSSTESSQSQNKNTYTRFTTKFQTTSPFSRKDQFSKMPTFNLSRMNTTPDQPSTLEDSCNLKQIKMGKIHSLFNDDNIKSVRGSQIISQDHNLGESQLEEVEGLKISSSVVMQSVSISHFELGKCIGSGKFGDVFACRHKQTGLIFALKKVLKSTILEYNMVEQFVQELKINYSTNHPNIVKLYTHFSDDYHVFLLMEYATGGVDMTNLKKEEKEATSIVVQVIDAIHYLHSNKIVHRDIKPQNLVLFFESTVKICDFGWSGFVDQFQMKKTFCGTLDYLSPEMKDGYSYSYGVDIWSIGVLTFELMTGQAPFRDELVSWRKKGSLKKINWQWSIVYPPYMSTTAESFIRNLLKEKPEQRSSLKLIKSHFLLRKYKQVGKIQEQINSAMAALIN